MMATAPWYRDSLSQQFSSKHQAVDIRTPFHTAITSLWGGTVVDASTNHPYGGQVIIASQVPGLGTIRQGFVHLDTIAVRQGQTIGPGTFLGLSGGENPGYPGGINPALSKFSTGPHTHFSLQTSRGFINPAPVLSGIGGTEPNTSSPAFQAGTQAVNVATSAITQGPSGLLNSLNPLNAVGDFFTRAGIFILALMVVLLGIVLIAWEPAKAVISKGMEEA